MAILYVFLVRKTPLFPKLGYNKAVQTYQIILLVLLLLAFFYVALLLFVISNMREFKRRLSKREKALLILMNEKSDLLLDVCALLKQAKVEFSQGDEEAIKALEELRFDKVRNETLNEKGAIIHAAHSHINYIVQSNNWLKKDLRFSTYRENYDELDQNYRQSAAIYNSDVAGYMYWFSFPTCTLAVRILGYRGKESLN